MIPADLPPIERPPAVVETVPARPDPIAEIMRCIRAHESDTAGGYRAENPVSTASGAYQFLDGTWRNLLRESGIRGPARASQASPALQDRVARYSLTHGHAKSWDGTGCPTTTRGGGD